MGKLTIGVSSMSDARTKNFQTKAKTCLLSKRAYVKMKNQR